MPPPPLPGLQTDAGSLNGTLLNGKVISTQYREMGLSHPLSDGDAVEFGSLTKSMVTLVMPAEDPATGCDSGGSVTKRRHAGVWAHGRVGMRDGVNLGRLSPRLCVTGSLAARITLPCHVSCMFMFMVLLFRWFSSSCQRESCGQ